MADSVQEEEQGESRGPAPKKAKMDSDVPDREPPSTKSKRERRLRHQPKDVLEFSDEVEHAGINVYNFAQARAEELKTMLKTTTSRTTGKRVFQSLPRHMRRRAMSHNVKRLPRRLREAAKREMATQSASAEGSGKKKPPSRRTRRRPLDLAKEYMKREDKCTWLETHIWHAKRMKMAAKWGFKLAVKRADKGIRAAYHSMKSECLLSDISYYHLIEVCGPQEDVLAVLNQLTSPDTGLTCGASSFLSGEREGKVLLYQAGQFPNGFIGPARILWRPMQAAQKGTEQVEVVQASEAQPSRTLWLWLHPTTAEDAHHELQTASSTLSGVTVSWLKDQFAQFCLWGPRSLAVLASVLKPAQFQSTDPQSTSKGTEFVHLLEKEKEKDEKSVVEELQWWKKLEPLQVDTLGRNHASFARLQELDSSSQVPTGLVLGTVVCDPRLNTPAKRQHVAMGVTEGAEAMGSTDGKQEYGDGDEASDGESGGEDETEKKDVQPLTSLDGGVLLEGDTADTRFKKDLPSIQQDSLASVSSSMELAARPLSPSPQLAYSPLWDSQLRMQASRSKVSDAILNKVRSTGLVRSAELHLGDLGCCVPVLLVHQDYQTSTRPRHSHYASGWSLICPKQWGMPFFVNLVYRCAHVCGLQELQQAAFESGTLHFPTDYPDSPASKQEWKEEGCALEEAYTRYPPAKRPNYGKLSVQSPFHMCWDGLMKDKEGTKDGFYVLRSQSALLALHAAVGSHSATTGGTVSEELLTWDIQRGLVTLDVTMLHKGCPQPRAMVCLPLASDLEHYKTDPQYAGPEENVKPSGVCIVEKGSVCIGQSQLCKRELKVAKQQWRKDLKKKSDASVSPSEDHTASEPVAVASLQLCEVTPSRKVIGYITSGGFSHRLGCGRGVGLCPVSDLLKVVQQSRLSGLAPTVLIRNPNSRQYFAAQVAVH